MGKRHFDLSEAFEQIEAATRGKSVVLELRKLCALCGVKNLPSALLARELKRLESWFATLWQGKAPSARLNALYFGIAEFEGGRYDLRCEVVRGRGDSTEEWDFEKGRVALEYAGSEVLAQLSSPRIIKDRDARHCLSLGYASLVAAHLSRRLQGSAAKRRWLVAAGYDEGDQIFVGSSSASGVFQAPAQPPAVTPKLAGKSSLFGLLWPKKPWMLDYPRSKTRELDSDYATNGKRVKSQPLSAKVYLKGAGPICDISFSFGEHLVVKEHVGAMLAQLDAKGLQRLPIRIEGVPGKFELINALKLYPLKRLQQPRFQATLGGAQLLRSDGSRPNVLVTRPLVEALQQAHVSGVSFVPFEKLKK